MKRPLQLVLIYFLVLAAAGAANAADVEVTAQVRLRTELNAKDFNSSTAGQLYSLQRTRLGARIKAERGVLAFVQLQDSRTWGSETNTLTDASADALDLHQGYLVLSNIFGKPLSVKAGRLEMAYGNQRLIGAVGWSNTGRAFDGVILRTKKDAYTLDLWVTALRDSSAILAPGKRDGDKYFFGAYGEYNWGAGDNHSEVFVLYDLDRDTIPRGPVSGDNRLTRITTGAVHTVALGNLKTTVEGAYQTGSMISSDTTSADIKAYFFAINAEYSFPDVNKRPSIGAGIDWISGDENLSDGTFGEFNTLYATGHKWYGYMDYFPSSTDTLGLRDYTFKTKMKPNESTWLALDYHRFERDRRDAANKKTFGDEIDVTFKYKYSESFTVQAGYSVFLPGAVFEAAGKKDNAHWFYLMGTASL